VVPTAPSTNTTTEDTAPAISWNSWTGVGDAGANGGSHRVSRTTNAKASFSFTGTSVTWLARKGPDRGRAAVTIDGVSKGTVDLYSADVTSAAKIYAGLANRRHTIVVRVLGTKSAAASAVNVSVDGFI